MLGYYYAKYSFKGYKKRVIFRVTQRILRKKNKLAFSENCVRSPQLWSCVKCVKGQLLLLKSFETRLNNIFWNNIVPEGGWTSRPYPFKISLSLLHSILIHLISYEIINQWALLCQLKNGSFWNSCYKNAIHMTFIKSLLLF